MKAEQPSESPTAAEIARAMEHEELVLYYQPKVCLLRGTVVGAEALVRWTDPHSRVLSPSVFLPQIEASGLLHDLTVRLLDDVVGACATVREHASDISLSINVAPNDLVSQTISSRISSYISGGSIEPHELIIEITESTAMGNFNVVLDELNALTAMGIQVLMDDFGTGHSSVARLSQLPFTAIKLDQGVVRRMSHSSHNLSVVRSIISMARELGMGSIAEGVETAEQYNILIANGCEEVQGFYISKPIPLNDFIEFVKSGPEFPASHIGAVHQALYNVLRYRKSITDIAVCAALGAGQVPPSIANFRTASGDSVSRITGWYYGIGQLLESHSAFRALEAPLNELKERGAAIQHELLNTPHHSNFGKQLDEVDRCANEIVALMHRLERALLVELTD